MSEMKKPTASEVVRNLMAMCDSVNKAEDMSIADLCTALAELKLEGGEHIASLKSAVKGESIHRLKHPLTWRIIRWWNRRKRHA